MRALDVRLRHAPSHEEDVGRLGIDEGRVFFQYER